MGKFVVSGLSGDPDRSKIVRSVAMKHDRKMLVFMGGAFAFGVFCWFVICRSVDLVVLASVLIALGIFAGGWFFGMVVEQQAAMRGERESRARIAQMLTPSEEEERELIARIARSLVEEQLRLKGEVAGRDYSSDPEFDFVGDLSRGSWWQSMAKIALATIRPKTS
jgi:hypothetical protein